MINSKFMAQDRDPYARPLEIAKMLRLSLRAPASAADTDRWLELLADLERTFETVATGSSRDSNLVGRIRRGLLQVISAVRDGYVPDFARATAPLTSLEISLRRRAAAQHAPGP